MANWGDSPFIGQTVWHARRNGIIYDISRDLATHEKIIHVDFYDKGLADFDEDDFIGAFDDQLNQWVLPQGVEERS